MAEQVTAYWPQILAIVTVIVMFVKLKSAVGELRKDVDDIIKRDTYTQVVKLRADLDALKAGKHVYCEKSFWVIGVYIEYTIFVGLYTNNSTI